MTIPSNKNTIILLDPTTDAATTEVVTLAQDATGMTVVCNDLVDDEEVTVEIYDAAQNEWYPYIVGGQAPKFNTSTNTMDFYWTWGQYRFVKLSTTNPVGISVRQYNVRG